ncbi:hypothetical protein AB0D42_23520 [Streptomyces sp. NPDC048304]|uniref:hypothetical protein n=1 Tax=Streptomyces sp. NPDC048304 TaxID=3154820 RepID=UPI0033E4C16B
MGYDEGALAKTGVGAITLFGTTITLGWIVTAVVAAVLIGAFAYRWGTRGRRMQG